MSAATILFTDIVSFSTKPTAEQRRLVESLTSEVVHELRVLLTPPLDTPSIVALPTGDGLALAFLHRTNQPWDHTTILRLILRMHRWANNQSSPHNLVSLRVGVHVGAVELVTDINGKANLCGDTINFAQRVMDAANRRQTLYSEAAFREYVGSESPSCTTPPFSEDFKADFLGPIQVYAKHGLQIPVYKLSLEPPQPYWSNDDPIAKQFMLVTLTPLPDEIKKGGANRSGDSHLQRFESAVRLQRSDNKHKAVEIAREIPKLTEDQRFIIALCGSAAIGKSTFASHLASAVIKETGHSVSILPTDAFALSRAQKSIKGLQGYEPESHNLEQLRWSVRELIEGKPVIYKPYQHEDGKFGGPRQVQPAKILIVEGVYSFEPMNYFEKKGSPGKRKVSGFRVYLHAAPWKAQELKFAADVIKRNKTVDQAFEGMEKNYFSYNEHIKERYYKFTNFSIEVNGYWSYT